MKRNLDISITTGRFRKIREWNRRKNYYIKELRLNVKIYIAKLVWDKRRKSSLDINAVKTILILRTEGTIGDVVVTSPLVRRLCQEGYIVDMLLTKASSVAMKYNPYIRNVYEADDCHNSVFLKDFHHTVAPKTIDELNRNQYDLVIDPCLFDIPVHRMKLLRHINARFVLGINQWNCINHYSKSISFENGKEHVTRAISLIADCIGIDSSTLGPYDLYVPDDVAEDVKRYLADCQVGKVIIINAFTGSTERNISQEQLSRIIAMLNDIDCNTRIIILDHRNELAIPLPDNVVKNPFRTLHHVMALIKDADMVISPDTSVVHMSAAWEKPLVSVYKDVVDNNDLWGPGYDNASQIIVHNRKISDVDTVPELILSEVKRRNLLGNSLFLAGK
ncbi:glycosyltransferase family 9 protein [Serratia rubidaea]|uniref:Lipopolysaccharide core biosynthesis protein n=1 Tax=Serratia rubidaea TaxID=61652 RepID=A0A3S5AT23_SERRU|nr:glycosyltransferase family 9 protein [Serratia rubidaea]VEI69959.1 lipopolysaccharide core biosynthesis protein [Serratia rubidaea]